MDMATAPQTRYAPPALSGFQPRELLSFVRRRLRLFVLVAGSVVALTLLYTFTATPRYTATANIILDTRKTDVVKSDQVVSDLARDSATVDTQVQLLMTRDLARLVTQRLALHREPEFNPALRSGWFGGKAAALPAADAPVPDYVVSTMMHNLSVKRTGISYLIALSFESQSPKLAARIANGFADAYLEDQSRAKANFTRAATLALQQRIADLKRDVEIAEGRVLEYRARHNLTDVKGASVDERSLADFTQQISEAKARQAQYEAQLRAARASLGRGTIGSQLADSGVLAELRNRRADILQQRAQRQNRLGSAHPEVLALDQQLAEVEQLIARELNRSIASLEAQVAAARGQSAALVREQERSRRNVNVANTASTGLAELERRADAARTVYASFLNRSKETEAQESIQQPDSRIASRASVPLAPSSPNKLLNLVLGVLLGSMAGFVAAGIAALRDRSLSSSHDVIDRLGVAFLGAIPLTETLTGIDPALPPHEIPIRHPLNIFSEALRGLWAATTPIRRTGASVVAVTSAVPNEGKTTTALALARQLVLAGNRVVILDTDRRRRSLTLELGLGEAGGFIAALDGRSRLDQLLVKDAETSLFILPIEADDSLSRDLFATSSFARLIDSLRGRFDAIILDTPPLLPVAESRIIASKCDFAILMIAWQATSINSAAAAIALLDSLHVQLAGAAFSKVDLRRQTGYGYDDALYSYGGNAAAAA